MHSTNTHRHAHTQHTPTDKPSNTQLQTHIQNHTHKQTTIHTTNTYAHKRNMIRNDVKMSPMHIHYYTQTYTQTQ